jgi:dephospho-CoA kinase
MNHKSGIANSGRAIAVAVTGGMGSGKSAVARFLGKRLQWRLLDADLVCRTLLAPQGEGWKAFIHSFGSGYLDKKGEANRSQLRRQIFGPTGNTKTNDTSQKGGEERPGGSAFAV